MDFHINFTEAGLVETGNRLDVAIQGDGFFVINTENGTAYTRNGQFAIDRNKRLVAADGSPVAGQGGADIILDGKEITVAEDGTIYVDKKEAGRLRIVDFKDKSGLKDQGKSRFINMDPNSQETVPDT
jgi:flagellar basal body rod protein FlgG